MNAGSSNRRIPDRVRLPVLFEPALLERDLQRLAGQEWVEHFVKDNYEGQWSVLPLRGPAGESHPIRMSYSDPSCTEFEDTVFLEPCAYFKEVLQFFACPLQSVRLMKLTPDSLIKEHTDFDLAYEEGRLRLHIPIATNEQVDFRLNGSRVRLREGETWYLRLQDPHSVANHGPTDRVHLVIDAVLDPWLDGLIRQALGSIHP